MSSNAKFLDRMTEKHFHVTTDKNADLAFKNDILNAETGSFTEENKMASMNIIMNITHIHAID